MIVDSSALVAILAGEPERERFIEAIVDAEQSSMTAPTMLETAMVVRKFGPSAVMALKDFVRYSGIDVIPFEAQHVTVALEAFMRFGCGSGHAAELNYGDCLSYAASVVSGRPLLYKGDNFAHTEVVDALKAR